MTANETPEEAPEIIEVSTDLGEGAKIEADTNIKPRNDDAPASNASVGVNSGSPREPVPEAQETPELNDNAMDGRKSEAGGTVAVESQNGGLSEGRDALPAAGVSESLEDPGIEEGYESYGPGLFHPVYIGDVYNGRYEVLRKIGWGQYSTVWMVKDLTKELGDADEFKALKILAADSYNEEAPVFEREILTHLREADKSHVGYGSICHLLDDFELQGPNGTHVCLVFELMGETLRTLRAIFPGQMLTNTLTRKLAYQLLTALDYAHDNRVIHTDIKPDNIFVKISDRSKLQAYLDMFPAPVQDKTAPRYCPIPSRPLSGFHFGESLYTSKINIALGDWGVSSWTDKHLTELIQPVTLRAPEVLIGAPWDLTTDWWNLGVVLLEIFRGVAMFPGQMDQHTPYDLAVHLAQIVDFFGPFPKALLDQGNPEIVARYFNDDGTIRGWDLEPGLALDDDAYMDDLPQENREAFVEFLYALMKINPADRLPTQEIVDQDWIRHGAKIKGSNPASSEQ